MASPDIKNGYTPIANELMEALAMARVPGQQFRVLMVILRKTYGYKDDNGRRKTTDWIAVTQFVEATGIENRGSINNLLSELADKNMIRTKKGMAGQMVGLQKDYEKWRFDVKLTPKPKPVKKAAPKKEIPKPQPKKKTTKPPANPDVKTFLAWWAVTYNEKLKEKYHISWGKDGAIVKGLLTTFTLDQMKAKALVFMDSKDEWVLKAGKTIAIFKSRINTLSVGKQSTERW